MNTTRQAAGGAPLAACTQLTKAFGHVTAVRDVSMQIGPGEIVGLLGANGAGKTTLIRMLLGLLSASSGTVTLFGEPPSRRTRARLGYVPQGLGLYDDLSPAENLQFSAAVFGRAAGNHGTAPDPAGLAADLRRYARQPTGSLPLGVQRRVAFAQALAHRPELLVLDEPTSGVDPLGRARLWETITDTAQAGAGVLVTTHYMDEASECGRLVIMADGSVVAAGTAAEIVGQSRVTVVQAHSWQAGFRALAAAGLPVALAGRSLRVPGAGPDRVRQALGDLPAQVSDAPATLEERFFELAAAAPAAGAAR